MEINLFKRNLFNIFITYKSCNYYLYKFVINNTNDYLTKYKVNINKNKFYKLAKNICYFLLIYNNKYININSLNLRFLFMFFFYLFLYILSLVKNYIPTKNQYK